MSLSVYSVGLCTVFPETFVLGQVYSHLGSLK